MKLLKVNTAFAATPVLIFTIGFVTLFSTSPKLISNHIFFFLLGLFVYIVVSLLDYEFFKSYGIYMYGGVLILLFITLFWGRAVSGAVRWIGVSSYAIQPSEFTKPAIILFISSFLAKDSSNSSNAASLLKLLSFLLIMLVFVVLQPDLGTSLIILFIFAGIMLYAGVNKQYFLTILLLLGVFSTPLWNALREYQKERIVVFLNPAMDALGSGYNVIQSMIAVGSGGFTGRGFGNGTQTHLQFLPVYWTDFIFAAFAEEWGFVGVFFLVLFYVFLLCSILYIGYKSNDAFGCLICAGAFVLFFSQFFINVGMNLGLTPVTGIPLPLVSYGGSSMITSFFLLGVVQSVWIHRKSL